MQQQSLNSANLSNNPPQPAEAIGLSVLVNLLQRRWRIFLAVVVLTMVLSIAALLLQKKIYEASTKLVVVTKTGALGAGEDILGALDALKQGRSIDTQVEIVNNPDLLSAAYMRLTPAERSAGFHPEPGQTGPPTWSFDIKSKQDTDVIIITTHAYDPRVAADFANAISAEYLDEDRNRNSQATRQARQFVEREINRERKELKKAAILLSQLQNKTGLVAADIQVSTVAQRESDASDQFLGAKGDALAAQQRLALVRRQLTSANERINASTTIAANPEFSQVQSQIIQLEGQITEQSQEFKPNSPEIQQLRQELAQEQDHLRQVSRNIVDSNTVQANPLRLKLLEDYADAQSNLLITNVHLQAVQAQLHRLRDALAKFPTEQRVLAEAQLRVDILKSTYTMLSDRFYTLLIEERASLSNGIIAGLAAPSGVPSSPKLVVDAVLALIIALLFGTLSAFAADSLDRKIHTPDEAERISGATAVGYIPEAISTGQGSIAIGSVEPAHAFLESFRLLRNNIEFSSPDADLRTVAITSSAMSEGKSTVAMNLAIAMSMDGKRVLLLDCDLRRPNVHKLFRMPNDFGFTSAVMGISPVEDITRKTQWESLSVITSGPIPPDPTEFLNSQRTKSFITQLKSLYDVVILDSPPSAGLSDMQVIGRSADGVVVIVSMDSTETNALQATMRLLRQASVPLIGLVINRMKANRQGYYDYYGYYSTNYSYAADDDQKS